MISKIILPHTFDADYNCDLLIGVDYGAFQLAKKAILMDVAIGDFDSVSNVEFELIKKYSKKIIKLDVDKNETDSEAALMFVSEMDNYSVEMISDLDGRFDHMYNNFRLLNKYKFKITSQYNEILKFDKGKHDLKKTHKYLSIFANDVATISLSNTLYELDNVFINKHDTYLTSNEFVKDVVTLNVISGSVIVILSDDQ